MKMYIPRKAFFISSSALLPLHVLRTDWCEAPNLPSLKRGRAFKILKGEGAAPGMRNVAREKDGIP